MKPMARSRLPVASTFARHLLSLSLPLVCLAFLAGAPHPWYGALPWLLVIVAAVLADDRARPLERQPFAGLPAWPFDAALVLATALQVLNLALLARMAARDGLFTADALVAVFLVGTNSGYSGITVAHELVHRPARRFRLMGRLLLAGVLYEHFYTEHLRGHHARVGTDEDPATARFGESYRRFLRRTIPGQFRSAWRLECKRLGDERMGLRDPRLLRSRVVHGLLFEWGVAAAILVLLGPAAFALYLLQAWVAVSLLEAVNYFEHWGLTRRGKRVATVDSWDTESWFTLYSLVGLGRHADHHANASRPYQELRHFGESPKLPSGYFGMVVRVIFANRKLRATLTEELRRTRLGPFQALDPRLSTLDASERSAVA